MENLGEARYGRGKKKAYPRIGGTGILVGALAVAFVVGTAIRIRRYRSSNRAKTRFQCSSLVENNNEGLRSLLRREEDSLRDGEGGPSETIVNGMLEGKGIDTQNNIMCQTSHMDQGEGMREQYPELQSSTEDEDEDADADDKAGDEEEEEYDDAENEEECIMVKYEEGSQGTEDSSAESNAEMVWPLEFAEWSLQIKEIKTKAQEDKTAKAHAHSLKEKENRGEKIPVKMKLRIWIWTMLMLLLLLLLSVSNQKSYISLSY